MLTIKRFALVIVVLVVLGAISWAEDTWTDIAPGIVHLHRQTDDPLNINVLFVDLTHPEVRVGSVLAADETNTGQYEVTSSMGLRTGAIAAVNGDYFGWGHGAEGFTVVDGSLINFDATRSNLVISTDEVAYIGRQSSFEDWMYTVVGGGPRFVNEGQVEWERNGDYINGEYFPNSGYWDNPNPRTAVGASADGTQLILAVVDGRQPGFSIGMTPWQMADLMIEMGAWMALKLDGGGSSTFFLNGEVLNSPSDGSERLVANALLVNPIQNMLPNHGFENDFLQDGESTNISANWNAYEYSAGIKASNPHPGWIEQPYLGLDLLEVRDGAIPVAHSGTQPAGWSGHENGIQAKKYKLEVWVYPKAPQGADKGLELFAGTSGRVAFQTFEGLPTNEWNYVSLVCDNRIAPVALGEPFGMALISEKISWFVPCYFDNASLVVVDSFVSWDDLRAMCEHWLETGPDIEGDFNNDGTVNFLDFAEFALAWQVQ